MLWLRLSRTLKASSLRQSWRLAPRRVSMALSKQKIRELTSTRTPQIYNDVVLVVEFLDEPYLGTKWDIVRECDMSIGRLNGVLQVVRDPRFVREFQCTIPYV